MKKRMKSLMVLVLLFCVVFSGVGLDFSYAHATENTELTEDTESIQGTELVESTEEVVSTEQLENVGISTEVSENTEKVETTEPEQSESGWRTTTAERRLYYDDFTIANIGKKYQGETIEELLEMDVELVITDWESFFEGSCLAGTDKEGLLWLQEQGYTLEKLISDVSDAGKGNIWYYINGIETLEAYENQTIRFTAVTDVVQIPAIGNEDAPFYYMKLNREFAFCGDCGKHMYPGTTLEYKGEIQDTSIIKALVYADNGGKYEFAQIYVWAGGDREIYALAYAQYLYSKSNPELSYQEIAALTPENNSSFNTYYMVARSIYSAINNTDITGCKAFLYSNGNSLYQRIYSLERREPEEDPVTPPPATGDITVYVRKTDASTGRGLAGATFNFYQDDTLLGSAITDVNGYAACAATGEDGVAHTYRAEEVTARTGYLNNGVSGSASLTGLGEVTIELTNQQVHGSITITKTDAETGRNAQGDATLEGAVYGLYARSDIVHPDGHTGVLYGAGSIVATFPAIGDSLSATVSDLHLGNYYVKEIKAPTGYLLDTRTYDVTLAYGGQTQASVSAETTVRENVIKGNIRLVKHLQENDPALASRPQVPEVGAEFDVILKSSGRVYAHIVTDEDGYAQANNLPYGTYIVRQTKGKDGYAFVNDFEVFVRAHGRTYSFILENLNYTAQLQILKQDAKSGELVAIAGTEFEIYTAEGDKVTQKILYPSKYDISTFVTDASGTVCLPEWLAGGEYVLKEVKVPYGYVLNTEEIPFKIARENEVKDEWGDSVVQVVCENQPVQGKLTLQVTREVLTGFGDNVFKYQSIPSSNTTYQVYANENILSPDNQTDENGKRIILYKSNELVGTITTDENGMAVLEDLPLGSYYVKETNVPDGYALRAEVIPVKFEYKDDMTPVIEKTLRIKVERQKLDLKLYKASAEDNRAVAGATIGIYAANEIRNEDGAVIVGAGSLIETAVSKADGTFDFRADYPFGKYYAKEIAPPAGYFLSDAEVRFSFSYQGQKVRNVEITETYHNKPIPAGGLEVDKSTIQVTQPGDVVKFSIDHIKNGASIYVDEFTMTDLVADNTTLASVWTGSYSMDKSYSVSYVTNQNNEWRIWEEDLSTLENKCLNVSALGLQKGEKITAFRFEFGNVSDGFHATVSPCYMTRIGKGFKSGAEIKSTVQLTGVRGAEQYFAQDETSTTVWYGPGYQGYKETVQGEDVLLLPTISGTTEEIPMPDIQIVPGVTEKPEETETVEPEEIHGKCMCTLGNCWKLQLAVFVGIVMQISGAVMLYVAVKLGKKEFKNAKRN